MNPDTHCAAHAGSAWNPTTIGVASTHPICPAANVSKSRTRAQYDADVRRLLTRAEEQGYTAEAIPNGAWARTYPTVLQLDTAHAQQLAKLCADLCKRHGIPMMFQSGAPRSLAKSPEWRGVCCHHDVSTNGKWDCLPWLPVLRDAFVAAGFEVQP